MRKNVVKLSEYRKKKKREAAKGHGLAVSPPMIAAGVFALAVAVVFIYLVLTGNRP